MKNFFILIFSLLLFATLSEAQENRGIILEKNAPSIGKTYALIIGISKYKEVSQLDYADRDAIFFSEFLKSQSGGKIDSANIRLFVNEEATAMNIGDALMWLNKTTIASDKVYIFFAGHGDVEALNEMENGLLLLYKAPKNAYFAFGNDYLPVYEIKKFCKTLTNKKVDIIIITDACHAGKLSGGVEGGMITSRALGENWANEIKILSCQPDEVSQEGKQWGNGHGVFTFHLLEGLTGLADSNNDGQVSLLEIENYLDKMVPLETSPLAQTPFALGNKKYVIANIDNAILAALRKQKQKEIKTISKVKAKGTEEGFISDNDSTAKKIYQHFQDALEAGNLLTPQGESAMDFYYQLLKHSEKDKVIRVMQRNLAAALQDDAFKIIAPILKGEKVLTDVYELRTAAYKLDKAVELLGEDHYISASLKARKYFLEASALTLLSINSCTKSVMIDTLNLAIDKLQKSINLEPNAAYAYFGLAYALDLAKKSDKAIAMYKKYIDYVPSGAAAYNNIGSIYSEQKNYQAAIEFYQQAIEMDQSLAPAFYNLAHAYKNTGSLKNAAVNYRKAATLALKNNMIHNVEHSNNLRVGYIESAGNCIYKRELKKASINYVKAFTNAFKQKVFDLTLEVVD